MDKALILVASLILAIGQGPIGPHAILGSPPTAAVTFTHIQSCQADGSTSSTLACTFGLNIGAGHLVVIGCYWTDGANHVNSITGDGSFTQIGSNTGDPTVSFAASLFYISNSTGGAATLTANFNTATGSISCIGEEYSGQLTSGALDKNSVGTGTTSPTSSGSVTTTANGELIFGYHVDSVGSQAAGSGFTLRTSDASGFEEDMTEDLIQSTAGSTSATSTYGGGGGYIIFVATFKHS